jgi:hypothetical protein
MSLTLVLRECAGRSAPQARAFVLDCEFRADHLSSPTPLHIGKSLLPASRAKE